MDNKKVVVKKNLFVCALLFLVFFFPLVARGTVVEKNKIADVMAGLDRDTLVVFDIDNTILETTQTFGSDAWYYTTRDRWISEGMNKDEAKNKIHSQWMEIQKFTSVKAVEPITPKLIKQAQDQGIKVIALTARPFELMDLTPKLLASIGVDLSRNSISSKDFDIKSQGGDAKYRKGIIFCGGLKSDKGLILNDILKKLKLSPKKIVFIDDKKNNVEAVDKALTSKGLECECVRYGAADKTYKEYNQAIADVESEFFGKVLSDDAAKAILKSRNRKH